jgi:alginate O-acetyltransferase complex protein AlgJ
MRDHRWTAAASFREGQALDLAVVPWSDVEQRYGGYNRVELEDEDLLALAPWWAIADDEPPQVTSAGDAAELGSVPPLIDGGRDFAESARALVTRAETSNTTVVRGQQDWLIYVPELRTLTVGKFWGADAARVSRASNPAHADPLPAIVDFHQQLASIGVELIVLPIPAKATIYPDKLLREAQQPEVRPPQLDETLRQFYAELADRGVRVLDLTSDFVAHRDQPGGPLYCRQDTHWSPRACSLAARRIAKELGRPTWIEDVPRQCYETALVRVTIRGDLWQALGDELLPREELEVTAVGTPSTGGLEPVAPWRESPVLLLGDSHALVFNAGGDMHARGGGLPDHLALELGFPIDLVAVRGSGATPARIDLMRRRDNLAGKKLVIWCFSVREFTGSLSGWRPVPVVSSNASRPIRSL